MFFLRIRKGKCWMILNSTIIKLEKFKYKIGIQLSYGAVFGLEFRFKVSFWNLPRQKKNELRIGFSWKLPITRHPLRRLAFRPYARVECRLLEMIPCTDCIIWCLPLSRGPTADHLSAWYSVLRWPIKKVFHRRILRFSTHLSDSLISCCTSSLEKEDLRNALKVTTEPRFTKVR